MKLFSQIADKTVANTTTETTMFDTGYGNLTLPANFWIIGRTIRGSFHGSIATTGTPTARLKLKLGSTTILDTTAVTLNSITGTVDISGTFTLVCRTTGVSGSIVGDIQFVYYASQGGGGPQAINSVPAITTFDTTASGALDLTWTWDTASASNTITTQTMSIGAE